MMRPQVKVKKLRIVVVVTGLATENTEVVVTGMLSDLRLGSGLPSHRVLYTRVADF